VLRKKGWISGRRVRTQSVGKNPPIRNIPDLFVFVCFINLYTAIDLSSQWRYIIIKGVKKMRTFFSATVVIPKKCEKMPISQPRKLYLPAMVIVAVVLALLVFIGFSTYWNLNHARTNALKFLHQRGVATIQIIETSIRTLWGTCAAKGPSIDQLISEVGGNEYVAYAYMVGSHDKIMHQSGPIPDKTGSAWLKQMPDNAKIVNRILPLGDGTSVYELAARIGTLPENEFNDEAASKIYSNSKIVLGLNMSTYEMARHQDFHHAIVMLSILAILGGGAVFFIFVIHLYHRMNHRLRENQEYTRQVVDSMANGLLSVDEKGRVLSYNNLSLEILGLTPGNIEQTDLQTVIDFRTSGISQTLDECVSVMDREINITRPGGDELPLAISVTPIATSDNGCQGAVIILRDLREIKLLEEKVRRTEKLAALGKLAAAVAHEIRNPLSSIRGFAKFLSHALKDRPRDREYADVMVKEVDRINRVVTDLLNFASPLELEPSYVNPGELLAHTVRLVEDDARSRNITIKVDSDENLPEMYLDAYQMTHVLLNLVLNSLQAIGDGQSLALGIEQDTDSATVSFWVEDDGPGIAEDHIKKIFDPFFTRREKGTGLGLAIVQKIVENHHGRIDVLTPLRGKTTGCRFTISIPMDLESKL